ncbi:rho guanine nucleotide exchange factor 10-like protein isoform X3 [Ixodes scapularis]|nr:rho guanine nucleotide exchange factor 10-like protein isoform X3 [Ixodes scapularis]
MSAKAPYYYSELGPDKSPLGALLLSHEAAATMPATATAQSAASSNTTPPPRLDGTPPPSSSEPLAETSSGSPVADQGGGFFNPLLSIEPDVSVPDTPPKHNHKKKKKAKKKNGGGGNGGSPSKSNGIYGTTTAYARQLLFGSSSSVKGDKKNRRGSEPNIYEEITDAEEQYAAARSEQYLRGGGAPTIPRRPRPPPPYEGANPHVREEVTRVHRTHAHILENLNLDVETMLMPDATLAPGDGGCGRTGGGSERGDYGTVGGGKLGGGCRGDAYHHHPAATWRRVMNEYVEHRASAATTAPGGEVQGGTLPARASKLQHRIPYASHKTFQPCQPVPPPPAPAGGSASPYGRVPSVGSSSSGDGLTPEPLYMLYDDSHKRRTTLLLAADIGLRPEDNIYEEVDIYRRDNSSFEDGYSVAGSELGLDHSESSEEGDPGGRGRRAARLAANGKSVKKRKDSDVSSNLASSFTRFFSTRRKDFDSDKLGSRVCSRQLSEDEGYADAKAPKKQRPPLTLPAMPPGLTPEQTKRRLIVNNIVESENSYVGSLQRLICDFKRPLVNSQPPLVSQRKVDTMFFRLEEILQCHTLFGIALTQCVCEWDERERIGDVFLASFSKSVVLDIYSDFINNFSTAMETAKQAAKSKSAFSEFLKMKQIYSPDRLSFFGLMVKPVQRFPQFILLLQDLLKQTPKGHLDRMSLQLALTQLELLAEALNERKRAAEQHHAVLQVLGSLESKFSLKALAAAAASSTSVDGADHFLLRQDDVLQLEVDQSGLVIKSKARRIFLLNDLLVCVTVTSRPSSEGGHTGGRERLSLKWAVPLQEVDVQEDIAPATRNLLASSGRARNSAGRLIPIGNPGECSGSMQILYDELTDLVHDLEVMSRISVLVTSLKRPYPEITCETVQSVTRSIQEAVRHKDEEITLLDSCCLQLALPHKSKSQKVQVSFQLSSPAVKRDWTTDLRLAKLALDQNNMPAWDVPEQDKRPSSKLPLLVRLVPLYPATTPTEVKCGCFYSVSPSSPGGLRAQFLWLCSTDGVNSHLVILSLHHIALRSVGAFDLPESRIAAMEAVPPPPDPEAPQAPPPPGAAETVWITTESKRLILLMASCPDKWTEVGSTTVLAPVTRILYHCECVYVALTSGSLNIYRRDPATGGWDLNSPGVLVLGTEPITSLLPLGTSLYCACADKIYVLDAFTSDIQRTHTLGQEDGSQAYLMAHSGTGLWIALKNSSRISLYHTETFRHLQDVDVADGVGRFLAAKQGSVRPPVTVTSLVAGRGLLWVGTSAGVVLTLPLPRLEGVPILGGRTYLAHHGHRGPVTFLLCLQPRVHPARRQPRVTAEEASPERLPEEDEEEEAEAGDGSRAEDAAEGTETGAEETEPDANAGVSKQKSDSMLPSTPAGHKLGTKALRRTENVHMSGAKTLPRGLSLCARGLPSLTSLAGADAGGADSGSSPEASRSEVYGLYADLMNVQDYESHEQLNRSDPELMHFHFATLGRRSHRPGRPRSWDLSTMEVSGDSDSSAATCDPSNPAAANNMATTNTCAPPNTAGAAPSSSDALKSAFASSPSPSLSSAEGPAYGTLRHPRGVVRGGAPHRGGAATDGGPGAQQSKTLLTLTGGCGYVNWRKAGGGERDHLASSAASSSPSGDALVLIWEMKV